MIQSLLKRVKYPGSGCLSAKTRRAGDKSSSGPLIEWTYAGYQDKKCSGPTAQDFQAAFPRNNQDKALDRGDPRVVTLSAVQGLYQTIEWNVGNNEFPFGSE